MMFESALVPAEPPKPPEKSSTGADQLTFDKHTEEKDEQQIN